MLTPGIKPDVLRLRGEYMIVVRVLLLGVVEQALDSGASNDHSNGMKRREGGGELHTINPPSA